MTTIDKKTAERWRRMHGIDPKSGKPRCNEDQWQAFLDTCERTGLDPDRGMIYLAFGGKAALTIDGMRVLANSNGDMNGQDGPFWCGEDGEWVDAWISDKDPVAAKVVVYRRGCDRPFTGVAKFSEFYRPGKAFASRMIAKCAEADALRKAFPELLSSLYISEELDNINAGSFDAGRMKAVQSTAAIGQEKADAILTHLADHNVSGDELAAYCKSAGTPIPEKLADLPEADLPALRLTVKTMLAELAKLEAEGEQE
jgi:hypothetical protein